MKTTMKIIEAVFVVAENWTKSLLGIWAKELLCGGAGMRVFSLNVCENGQLRRQEKSQTR